MYFIKFPKLLEQLFSKNTSDLFCRGFLLIFRKVTFIDNRIVVYDTTMASIVFEIYNKSNMFTYLSLIFDLSKPTKSF